MGRAACLGKDIHRQGRLARGRVRRERVNASLRPSQLSSLVRVSLSLLPEVPLRRVLLPYMGLSL
jgi:hypothetical protein